LCGIMERQSGDIVILPEGFISFQRRVPIWDVIRSGMQPNAHGTVRAMVRALHTTGQ